MPPQTKFKRGKHGLLPEINVWNVSNVNIWNAWNVWNVDIFNVKYWHIFHAALHVLLNAGKMFSAKHIVTLW